MCAIGVGHVLNADEERDQVAVALQGTDRGVQRAGNTSLYKGVPGKGTFGGVAPAEQFPEEGPGCVWIARTDLGVHDGVTHDDLRFMGHRTVTSRR